jgi:hypothetical protein
VVTDIQGSEASAPPTPPNTPPNTQGVGCEGVCGSVTHVDSTSCQASSSGASQEDSPVTTLK